MVERRRKEIDIGWPTAKKFVKRLAAKGPLRTKDLRVPAQGVRQDIEMAGNKLRKQVDSMGLAQTQDGLGYGIEGLRVRPTLLLEICQRRGVVDVKSNGATFQKGKETPYCEEHRQQFPVVDGEGGAELRPLAG